MTEQIQLTVDGRTVQVPEGTTLLKAARAAGIEIPVICYSGHTRPYGLCRLCVVESASGTGMLASCVSLARAGEQIQTRTPNVERARRTILEMLASSVDLSESPELQRLQQDYQARPERFAGAERREHPLLDDNPVYVRDYSKCLLCWRCVQVCADDAQYTYAINFSGRGFHTSIATFFDKPIPQTTCVFCGQCVGTCPTGALKAKREHLMELGVNPDEIAQQTRVGRLFKRP